MKILALAANAAYRRYLSPYKGFACAYRVLTGGNSCSAYGYQVIERHGLSTGLLLLRRRLDACAWQHHHRAPGPAFQPKSWAALNRRGQAGFCDFDCDWAIVDTCCDLGDMLNGRQRWRHAAARRQAPGAGASRRDGADQPPQ